MTAENVAGALASTTLVVIGLVLVRLWHDLRVDSLRQQLFVLRDELFDYAMSVNLGFSARAYVLLRQRINRHLRFAHKLSLLRVLAVWFLCVRERDLKTDRADEQAWQDALSELVPEHQARLQAIDRATSTMVLRHISWRLLGGQSPPHRPVLRRLDHLALETERCEHWVLAQA